MGIVLDELGSAIFIAECKVGYKFNIKTDMDIIFNKDSNGRISIKPNPNFIGKKEVKNKIKQGKINVYNYLLEKYPDKDYAEIYKNNNKDVFINE